MTRIKTCLETLASKNRKALVPYIVAGDPEPAITVKLMHTLVDNGADIIELGIPFSDPMAEGPVIQQAHERALAHHVSLRDALAMVSEFRQKDAHTPVVLMGYANPIEVMGTEAFADAVADAGVDGILTVDLPPEESKELTGILLSRQIDTIYLVAPTTSPERIRLICSQASGYLYYVSLKGVTGAGNLDVDSVKEKLGAIRAVSDLPICVGFGIKDEASAQKIAELADGAVVGSALVDKMAAAKDNDSLLADLGDFIALLRKAIDKVS